MDTRLVLVWPEQEALVRAALDAGAHSCLVLPVHAKDLVSTTVARAGIFETSVLALTYRFLAFVLEDWVGWKRREISFE